MRGCPRIDARAAPASEIGWKSRRGHRPLTAAARVRIPYAPFYSLTRVIPEESRVSGVPQPPHAADEQNEKGEEERHANQRLRPGLGQPVAQPDEPARIVEEGEEERSERPEERVLDDPVERGDHVAGQQNPPPAVVEKDVAGE